MCWLIVGPALDHMHASRYVCHTTLAKPNCMLSCMLSEVQADTLEQVSMHVYT